LPVIVELVQKLGLHKIVAWQGQPRLLQVEGVATVLLVVHADHGSEQMGDLEENICLSIIGWFVKVCEARSKMIFVNLIRNDFCEA
jgi:hypothetical protein